MTIIAFKEDDAEAALKAFRIIVDDQPEKGEWSVLLQPPNLSRRYPFIYSYPVPNEDELSTPASGGTGPGNVSRIAELH